VRRVWDTFIFRDELDLLEARLTELDGAVYRHVLAEAPIDHQGNPKPLHYAENKERFSAWQDKIIHVVADDLGDGDPTSKDHAQRDALFRGLGDYGPDDILLHSDADEIPRPEVLQKAPGHLLLMRNHVLAVNLLEPGWWGGLAGAAPGERPARMYDIRALRHDVASSFIHDAGWHFTWLGGPDAMRRKVRAFAEPAFEDMRQLIEDHAEDFWRDRVNPGSGGKRLILTAIDESWPAYVRELKGPDAWYWKPS
jgi:glycosyl transferase family 17